MLNKDTQTRAASFFPQLPSWEKYIYVEYRECASARVMRVLKCYYFVFAPLLGCVYMLTDKHLNVANQNAK
jgi:hypothetical protein